MRGRCTDRVSHLRSRVRLAVRRRVRRRIDRAPEELIPDPNVQDDNLLVHGWPGYGVDSCPRHMMIRGEKASIKDTALAPDTTCRNQLITCPRAPTNVPTPSRPTGPPYNASACAPDESDTSPPPHSSYQTSKEEVTEKTSLTLIVRRPLFRSIRGRALYSGHGARPGVSASRARARTRPLSRHPTTTATFVSAVESTTDAPSGPATSPATAPTTSSSTSPATTTGGWRPMTAHLSSGYWPATPQASSRGRSSGPGNRSNTG